MEEAYIFPIAVIVLVLGIPLGNLLAHATEEELKDGNKWFKILILVCLLGSSASLFAKNYAMLFSLLFMIVVASRSLKIRKF